MTRTGRIYLWLFRRWRRFSPTEVRRVTDDIFTVIAEFFAPPVTNHVIGDVTPAGGAVPPVTTPGPVPNP